MQDKTQHISSYVSGYGVRVYQVEQYNKQCDDWFIVGDCSENINYIASEVQRHNENIKYTHEWVNANIPF